MRSYPLDQHDLAVQQLAHEVAKFHTSQVPFRINHGSTNSTRRRDPGTPQLHISHLNHIINIDIEGKFALVEPNVPLDYLVGYTLGKGLMPLVVMEFPGITVGGGFSGASGESSGWKEGLFDCGIDEVELILGNGEIVRTEKRGVNSDLFEGARCTLGTLGVVTLLKVRLTQAKDAVQLVYQYTSNVSETINRLTKLCNDDNSKFDFIEGIQYSVEHGVIVTGHHVLSTVSNLRDSPRRRFDRATDPWFYMHAKDRAESYTEIVPTQSYLFRHDRGAFWSGEVFLKYYGLPNNRFVRWLLNPIITARAIYKAMLAADSADGAIIQDLVLPVETSLEFIDYVAESLEIWPLWICPIRKKAADGEVLGWPFYKTETQSSLGSTPNTTSSKGPLTLNFGVWCPTDPTPAAVRKTNRALEEKLRQLRVMNVPYAANFYTEEDFWDLYDLQKYNELRKKWHAEALPNMYDKVRRKQVTGVEEEAVPKEPPARTWKDSVLQRWPLGGLYQTFHVHFRWVSM